MNSTARAVSTVLTAPGNRPGTPLTGRPYPDGLKPS